jgi:hypothetical protein
LSKKEKKKEIATKEVKKLRLKIKRPCAHRLVTSLPMTQ